MLELKYYLVILPLVFLAGFVDSVAGGGGLISLPSYLLVGVPIHLASGTNKVIACVGTMFSSGKYLQNGNVKIKAAVSAAIGSLVGSYFGTNLAVYLDEKTLNTIILCALPLVAIFVATNKGFGETSKEKSYSLGKELIICFVIGLIVGCYDGLIGPGTGTFLLLAFCAFLGYDLLTSTGCAKIANLASNFVAAIVWMFNGKVIWSLVVPGTVCSIAGNLLGARYAIKGGSKKIKWMAYFVLGLLAIKLGYELIF